MRPTVEWAWRPGACAVRRPCCSSPPPQIELNCLGCQRQFREACHVGFVELLFGQHLVFATGFMQRAFSGSPSNMARPIRTNPMVDKRLHADGHSPLISFAVGLAWVALVFVWNRAFEASA
jgi:hypothetical protein